MSQNAAIIASLTVAEFKAFRKALDTLCRAYVERDTAIDLLVNAIHIRRANRSHDTRFPERRGA